MLPRIFLRLLKLVPIGGIILTVAIGRFYDERLDVMGFNISYLVMVYYFSSLLYIYFNSKIKIDLSFIKANMFFLLFVIISIVNILINGYNLHSDYSFNKLFEFITITIPLVFFVYTSNNLRIKKLLFDGFVLFALFFIIIAIYTLYKLGVHGRFSILGGGPIVFARWVSLLGVATWASYKIKTPYLVIIQIVVLVLIILSGSNGPLLFYVFVSLVAMKYRFNIFNKTTIFFITFFLSSLFFLNINSMIEALPFSNRLIIFYKVSKFLEASSSTARLDRWLISLRLIWEYPFGIGIGNFYNYAQTYLLSVIHNTDYPHNIILEIFLEHGIILGGIFISFLIRSFLKIKLFLKSNYFHFRFAALLLLVSFFNSLVSGDLSDSRILFITLSFILSKKTFYDLKLSNKVQQIVK